MDRSKDYNALLEEVATNKKKALDLVKKYSPNLSDLKRIQIDKDTHVFVPLDKYFSKGDKYFIDKYKHRKGLEWKMR